MADQKKRKNKPKKSKRAKNIKSARSASSDASKKEPAESKSEELKNEAVPSIDSESQKNKSPIEKTSSQEASAESEQADSEQNLSPGQEPHVDDKLKELESKYVTRPANVAPPLPKQNPDSIKKSGVQRAYNPTDRNLFPEESVYDMAPFILDEVRLTPKETSEEDSEKDSWGANDDKESWGSEEGEDSAKAESDDEKGWESEHLSEIPVFATEETDSEEQADVRTQKVIDEVLSGSEEAKADRPSEKEEVKETVEMVQKEPETKVTGERESALPGEIKPEGKEPSPSDEKPESDEKKSDEEPVDDWDKEKQSFKGSEGWGEEIYSHEVEDPWSVNKEVAKKKEEPEPPDEKPEKLSEPVNEFDDDYDKDFSLIGEDSIYELEPINLTEFGFGRLIEDEDLLEKFVEPEEDEEKKEPEQEEDYSEIPEVGPEIVSKHAEQEKIEQEISGNYQRFPEFSNFEIEPIKVEDDVLREAKNLDLQKQKDIASSADEALAKIDDLDLAKADDEVSEKEVAEDLEGKQDELATPYEREVVDTLLEGVPVIAPGESLTLEPAESDTTLSEQLLEPGLDPLAGPGRDVEDTLLELPPLDASKKEKQEAAIKERQDAARVAKEEVVAKDKKEPAPEEPASTEAAPKEPAEAAREEEVSLEEPSVDEPEQQTDEEKRRLIDLAEPNPEVASYVDQIAVQSETAAIAKEIQTQESMFSVGNRKMEEAIKQSGMYNMPGQTLEGKYLLRGVIGQGGISLVYKAQDLATGQIVAIKTLKEQDPDVTSRFSKEIDTLGKLNHQNIVRAIESFTQAGNQTFLVMEHIKGISLQELIKQYGRAEHPEVIASILMQVCDGLAHAHAHRIIHRDLKGGNIVLTNVNEKIIVKILDFGIAKMEDDDIQRVTIEGKAMGSPLYMSPEQCRGQPLTTKSDIYALGIVAYELITGELPIKGRSVVNVMAQHCDPEFRPVPMSNIRPDLPGVHMLDQIIYKALETEVDHRLQRAEQFKSGIKYWIDSVRVRNYSNIIPPEVLFSEEIAMTDQAIEKNLAAEVGTPSGKNLRSTMAENEKTAISKSSFPEILGTTKGVKFYFFATVIIAIAVIICLYLMKYLGG